MSRGNQTRASETLLFLSPRESNAKLSDDRPTSVNERRRTQRSFARATCWAFRGRTSEQKSRDVIEKPGKEMDCPGRTDSSDRAQTPKVLLGNEERQLSSHWQTATGADLPRMLESRHSKSDINNTQSFAFKEAQRIAERRPPDIRE